MSQKNNIGNGVMLNAYPDSIGENLKDLVSMLKLPEFKNTFSLFYVLPTFFNSDLDRGFSVIDYNLNEELVSKSDLEALKNMHIKLKFDIVLNHLSVASPQFKDILEKGEDSKYKDFFINWNDFWKNNGTLDENGINIPNEAHLSKLFMRKAGLPILKVRFPDGTEKPYWNTFYQQINYSEISTEDLTGIDGLHKEQAQLVCNLVNLAITTSDDFNNIDFKENNHLKKEILQVVEKKRSYLGQMDVNGKSPLVWEFYEETLKKLSEFGCSILRLDAFAYLHKEIGQSNFFNAPGTWDYLDRINGIAKKNNLTLLPEIHAEYGLNLHDEVAKEGYSIYDFFLPGLMLHTLEKGSKKALVNWVNDIVVNGYHTINMLGCHDGIPVLDLKGKEVNGQFNKGLLEDQDITNIMDTVIARGGRVKNLYGPNGEKISYYQVNATFYSALGESDEKMLLARAIQLFMPGIPQIWYLDIFAGKNNHEAADKGGSGGHKEINRTTLSLDDVKEGLQKSLVANQLKLIQFRNTVKAFSGIINIENTPDNQLHINWVNNDEVAQLNADLSTCKFTIKHISEGKTHIMEF